MDGAGMRIGMSMLESATVDGIITSREAVTQEIKAWSEAAKLAVLTGAKLPSETIEELTTVLVGEQLALVKILETLKKAEQDMKEKWKDE